MILVCAAPAYAAGSDIDTRFEFGKRGSNGLVEEEDLADEFTFSRYTAKFSQDVSPAISYYLKYQYYNKIFDTLEQLSNTFNTSRVSFDARLYARDGLLVKIGPDFEFKEKCYYETPSSNYDQIVFTLPVIIKKEGDWTVKATAGINSYHYPDAPKDQFKMNERIDVAKKLCNERLEVAAFLRYQEISRQKIDSRIERTSGASCEVAVDMPFLKSIKAGIEEGMDNTIIFEEREDSFDFKYFTWRVATHHILSKTVRTDCVYRNITRTYADFNHNFDGFMFENNTRIRFLDSGAMIADLRCYYLHKQFRYPYASNPYSMHNNTLLPQVECARKDDWKAYLGSELKFYDFPARRTNDKRYYRLVFGVEKLLFKKAVLVAFDYLYTFKNYLHKPDIIEDQFQIRVNYAF